MPTACRAPRRARACRSASSRKDCVTLGPTTIPREIPPDMARGRPPGEGHPTEVAPASAGHRPPSQGAQPSLMVPPWSLADLPARIAARVIAHPRSGCWVWTGRTDRDGYGRIGNEGIHRVVYRLLVGPIPADRPNIDHVAAAGCIFRRCCFPGHLEPATTRENALRGRSFAALNAAKVHCDHGHPYDAANTYRKPNGHRDCRACVRRRVAEYTARQRQAARAA